jgi:hypothetical protein
MKADPPTIPGLALLVDRDLSDGPLRAHEDQARALDLHPQGFTGVGANSALVGVFQPIRE